MQPQRIIKRNYHENLKKVVQTNHYLKTLFFCLLNIQKSLWRSGFLSFIVLASRKNNHSNFIFYSLLHLTTMNVSTNERRRKTRAKPENFPAARQMLKFLTFTVKQTEITNYYIVPSRCIRFSRDALFMFRENKTWEFFIHFPFTHITV